ncbi:hypothetical protein T3H97_13505 [Paenibacillus sp. LX16]|uniref:hypothetical protein n=1 Tax=Paenibacillus sp. LX16 TaxID=1740264 RepID=UPI0019F82799|nr:hypothetical protein [Paenibacillus sp. LX16]KAF6630855.1 hypothetical protein H6F38_15705 [Paenibacillus sp. EKM208P]
MAKWNVKDHGTQYSIEYKRSLTGGKIIVNGGEQKVKSQNAFLNLIDFPIRLKEKTVNVVVIGNKADLAVDGVYLGSNQPYVPVSKVPGWSWAFVVVSLVIGLLFSGIFGVCIGILGSMFYVKSSLSMYQTTNRRVVNCLIVFFIISVIQIVFGIAANSWINTL